jgi:hypothetical protein
MAALRQPAQKLLGFSTAPRSGFSSEPADVGHPLRVLFTNLSMKLLRRNANHLGWPLLSNQT